MSKNVNKNIHFGFFNTEIKCDLDDLQYKIDNLEKSRKENDKARLKMLVQLKEDMKNVSTMMYNLFESLKDGQISSSHTLHKKLIEIDRTTFIFENENVFFQMVHDRDDAISKKRLNEARVSIPLEDDEYISEFSGIIFHRSSKNFMVQHNRYSVSVKQLSEFLTECLKEKYQASLSEEQKYKQFPAKIDLKPIIDRERLNAVRKNKCLEKMTIKGDLSALENLKKYKNETNLPLFKVGEAISKMNGYEFTLIITANKTRENRKIEYESINQDDCQELYEAYEKVDTDKDNIDVTMQYQNEYDLREVLTWSSPLKECCIPFTINSREEIDFKDLYGKMKLQL